MSEQPAIRRATFPPDYGARGVEGDDPAAWATIEDKLRAAPNYWITTIAPDGRPHDRPLPPPVPLARTVARRKQADGRRDDRAAS